MNNYKISFTDRHGEREELDEMIEALTISEAIDRVSATFGYSMTFGLYKTTLKVSDDKKSAVISARIGKLEIKEHGPVRMFRVDTSDMPAIGKPAKNPIIDHEFDSIDHAISLSIGAALASGFLYDQLRVTKSDDGRSARMIESVFGSSLKITELNKYMVDLIVNGKREAGVGPFWGITVKDIIGILGTEDPSLDGIGIWWDIDKDADSAFLRHDASDQGTSLKIARIE